MTTGTRDINASSVTAATADTIHPVIFAKLQFDSGNVLVHSELGDLTYGGNTYTGIGKFGGISPVNETSDLSNSPLSLTLSGIPSDVAAILLGEHYQGRTATVSLGYLNLTTRALVADPAIIYRGLIDTADIQQDKTFTITLTVQSRFVGWSKPLVRRYNNADQQSRYPGDRFFEFVEKTAGQVLVWGGSA